MKRISTFAAVLAFTLGFAATANATGTVGWAKITEISGGWTVPMFSVQVSAPMENPDGCPSAGIYIVTPDAQSHDMFTSMLLTAYARGDQVMLTLSGCSTWPVIIGIRVRPAS
ncbi:hypothetical protein ASD79_20375 [Caulobacter sp. Root655]|uniref:hypothetical protein n=1 Tax=Caulobacter sp. Root655 TaxID=1736578 RepID=UPI0006FE061C|nr:hypothetical protein [Caulobacter sp. Root655]KRA64231.1 hypothetical protein ASD79_20375 [Caulobacter sp. Root655]